MVNTDLEPLKKKKLFQEIVSRIQHSIRQGDLKPGDQLPTERDLTQQLNVSRTSVREALLTLEIMGYIEIRQSKGAFVREVKLEDIIEPIISAIYVDNQMVLDLLDVRDLIETETARLAAVNATSEDLKNIEDAIIDAENEVEYGGLGLKGDDLFHAAIANSSGNQVYELIMYLIRDLLSKSREATLTIKGQPSKTIDDHRKVLDSIRGGDPEMAQKLMKEHLSKAKQNIISTIKQSVDKE